MGTDPKKPFYLPGLDKFVNREEINTGTPVAPRPAATVVVLRDGQVGLETYLIQRARGMKFLGGAHVFPGGRVDESDASAAHAAVREAQEEVDVELAVDGLHSWSRWVTPELEPRRFDAAFFVAELPAGQEPRPVPGEVSAGCWLTARAAIAAMEAAEIVLAPPTLWTLMELSGYGRVADVVATAALREVEVFRPQPLLGGDGQLVLMLAGDCAYGSGTVTNGASESKERSPGSRGLRRGEKSFAPTAQLSDVMRRFILQDSGAWQVVGGPLEP